MNEIELEMKTVRDYLASQGHVNIIELKDYYEIQFHGLPKTTYVKFIGEDGIERTVPTDIDFMELTSNIPPVPYDSLVPEEPEIEQ